MEQFLHYRFVGRGTCCICIVSNLRKDTATRIISMFEGIEAITLLEKERGGEGINTD